MKFEVGKKYVIYGSYDREYVFTVIKRTFKTVTVERFGEIQTKKVISFYNDGTEQLNMGFGFLEADSVA